MHRCSSHVFSVSWTKHKIFSRHHCFIQNTFKPRSLALTEIKLILDIYSSRNTHHIHLLIIIFHINFYQVVNLQRQFKEGQKHLLELSKGKVEQESSLQQQIVHLQSILKAKDMASCRSWGGWGRSDTTPKPKTVGLLQENKQQLQQKESKESSLHCVPHARLG